MTGSSRYLAPNSLQKALRAAAVPGAVMLAGGTDLAPRWQKGVLSRPETLIDIKRIPELHGIERVGDEIRIGACALMSEIETSRLIREEAPPLAKATGRIACPQIRNRATLGGNLCNASPAADAAVPLILLDAMCDIYSTGSGGGTQREIPITEFFKGPGRTALVGGELLAFVRFRPMKTLSQDDSEPRASARAVLRTPGFETGCRAGAFWAWDKFGTRPAMEIAVASVGVLLEYDGDIVSRARIAYGSVAPVPMRGYRAEAAIVGTPLTDFTIAECAAAAREEISPISDVRAGAGFRRRIIGVYITRMLQDARNTRHG